MATLLGFLVRRGKRFVTCGWGGGLAQELNMKRCTIEHEQTLMHVDKVVEAMRSNDNWGFNNWRSCGNGHLYIVGRFLSPNHLDLPNLKTRCGGPLEERPCPVLDCDEMIGGADEILNDSNRQKTFQIHMSSN